MICTQATRTAYESARIESVAGHFLPDNSGGVCAVCLAATFSEGDELDGCNCDECGGSPGAPLPQRRVTDREELSLLRCAEFTGQSRSVCHDCAYPVRRDDGIKRIACYFCMTGRAKPADYLFCKRCGSFVARPDWGEEKCKWCTAASRAGAVAAILGPKGDSEFAKLSKDSQKRARVRVTRPDRYARLLAELDTPRWRKWMAENILPHFEVTDFNEELFEDDELGEQAQELFDVFYWNSPYTFLRVVAFLAIEHADRFARDPEVAEPFDKVVGALVKGKGWSGSRW